MKSKSLFNALSYTKSSNPITCISNYSSSIICIKTIHALEELNEYKSLLVMPKWIQWKKKSIMQLFFNFV